MTVIDFVIWIAFGAIAGWIASMIMGTNPRQGLLMDVILGIAGAVVGGLIMNLFGAPGVTGFNLYSAVVAVIGAIILIYLGRMFSRRTV